ncbi:MAG: SIS domain-containing protein [Capsulimonadales bacterium]|nr:SIS domain-containing protein [Capsulimonadales bacterium]
MSVLHNEIFEQPDALNRAIRAGREPIFRLVAEAKRRDVRYLVLAARGTSDNAATYAKYLFEIVCGVPVSLAAPSVHTLYESEIAYRDALVLGVSQSGAGADVIEVVTAARKKGALTAAFTNTEDSGLARAAEHPIFCHAGVETAVAATKTYTTTLALFAQLAAAWSGLGELTRGIDRLEHAAAETLNREEQASTLAQTLLHAERILTVARGLHLSTAIEAALKIAETTYTTTQAFSSADLQHGPIASVAVRTPCLLFMPRGKTFSTLAEMADKLTDRGARVLKFAPEGTPGAAIHLGDAGTELLAPIVDIIPAQLLAFHLCIARGLDPDNPRGLTKVTITR